jgi:hypothetical protein
VACLALFVALGGTVYAAARIDGHTIRVRSLPGNRLAPGSTPGNRIRAGTITGDLLAPGSVTGAQIDSATIGQVPSAVRAEQAGSAHDAEIAQNAVNAIDATRVNGHSVGCASGARLFAGACWQIEASAVALTATAAAAACADQGGELPEALALVAFSQQPGVILAGGDEWSGDITNASSPDAYAVITVSALGEVNFVPSTATKRFRCVIPLVV